VDGPLGWVHPVAPPLMYQEGVYVDRSGVYLISTLRTLKLIGFYGKHHRSVEDRNCCRRYWVVK